MKGTQAKTHEEIVVSVSGDTLTTIRGEGDDHHHHHTVAKDAKVSCDGQTCNLADLKAGTPIRVTTRKGDKNVVTAIEAGKPIPESAHTT